MSVGRNQSYNFMLQCLAN